jgi:hypothetical protein
VGEIGKLLQGEPKIGIKGKECHNTKAHNIHVPLITAEKLFDLSV